MANEASWHELRRVAEANQPVDTYAPKTKLLPVPAPAESNQESYLKQDFDGRTLYVSSLMATQEQVKQLIDLLTAMLPLVPS